MATGTKTSAFDEYGDTQRVLDEHKNDPIKYGWEDLPPGIQGTAILNECGPKRTDEGVLYWAAEATVESPEYHVDPRNGNRVKVRGQTTRISVFLDRETFDEKVAKIQEEIRKLGGEAFFDDNPGVTIEEASELLNKAKPRFRFTTSLGKVQIDPLTKKPKVNPKTGQPYEPRLWHNWNGTKNLEDAPESNPFDDNTAPPPAGLNGSVAHAPVPARQSQAEEFDDAFDLDTLLVRAEGGDEKAQDRLRELCKHKGWTDDQYDEADYAKVGEYLRGGLANRVAAAPAKSAGPVKAEWSGPAVGDYVKYSPFDKTGKRRLAARECEVKTVNKGKKTVTLRPFDKPDAEYKDVPWDELVYEK